MLKFAVFVSGGGTDLQSIIDAKNEGKINGEIALVLSNRQKAYGLQRAKDAGIETAVVKKDDALIVKMLKERNIDFITITSFGTNTLSSLSHCILHVSTREKIRNNLGTFSMNLSTLYLLDLLYSMYFSLNYEENKKKKIEISDEYETFVLSLIRDTTNDLIK